ncbi:alpha/beta hydrolase [Devosia sp.]|uniref:alpha/beta hydrolase n=1 Tax=Devosia sp. TaxID=1871048 RepID=UPI003BAD22BC
MDAGTPELITVGTGEQTRQIACLRRRGRSPGLFWLGGYRSEMIGSKATALDTLGAAHGLEVTRFDYSGHGQSGGDFLDGTISRWLEEALAVFALTSGPQVIIGSSMGGWLALLLARALRRQSGERVKALILIAPAVDMTEELMLKGFSKKELKALEETGRVDQPSEYSDQPYPITARLIDDGKRHLLFGRGIDVGAPVTILQGGKDVDVPRAHALRLVQHLLTDPVTFTLVPDGDHRLSRDQDLRLLGAAVLRAVDGPLEQLVLEL